MLQLAESRISRHLCDHANSMGRASRNNDSKASRSTDIVHLRAILPADHGSIDLLALQAATPMIFKLNAFFGAAPSWGMVPRMALYIAGSPGGTGR